MAVINVGGDYALRNFAGDAHLVAHKGDASANSNASVSANASVDDHGHQHFPPILAKSHNDVKTTDEME